MKVMYHATSYDNLGSILCNGLKAGCDGVVYLADSPENALKFVCLRGCRKIVTFKVKIYKKDEHLLHETFDHSYRFFKCKSYGFDGDIPVENIEAHMKYEI